MQYSTARKSRRVPLATEIHLKLEDVVDPVNAKTVNVSLGGLAVALERKVELGSLVAFELEVGGSLVEGTGEIAWIRQRAEDGASPAGLGIRYRYLSPGSRERIFRLVQWYSSQGGPVTPEDVAAAANELAPPAHPARPAPPGKAPPSLLRSVTAANQEVKRPAQPVRTSPGPSRVPQPLRPVPEPAAAPVPSPTRPEAARPIPFAPKALDEEPLARATEPAADLGPTAAFPRPAAPVVVEEDAAPKVIRAVEEDDVPPMPREEPEPPATTAQVPPARGAVYVRRRSFSLGRVLAIVLIICLLALALWFWAPVLKRLVVGESQWPGAHGGESRAEQVVPPPNLAPAVPAAVRSEPPAAPTLPPPEPPPEVHAASGPPAQALRRVRWEQQGGRTTVFLDADGAVGREALSSARLAGPNPRVIIRIRGIARLGPDQTRLTVGTGELASVRTGLHTTASGSELHVVLDLTSAGIELAALEAAGSTVRAVLQRAG